MRSALPFVFAVVGLLLSPRPARAIEGFPCAMGCSSDEKCVNGFCEGYRLKKAASPPIPPSCTYTRTERNVFVKSFQVTNAPGGQVGYSVEVCHEQPVDHVVCKDVGSGYVVSATDTKQSEPIQVHLGIYHHAAFPGPSCDQQPDIVFLMGVLDGNCSGYSSGTTPISRPTGSGPAWAFVEPGCHYAEKNENDNKAVELPDLRVRMTGRPSFGKRPGTQSSGVQVPFEICNDGGATPSSIMLGLGYGQPTTAPAAPPSGTPLQAYLFTKALDTLACRASVWWFPNSGALAPGNFAGWVVADPKASVKESKETNNSARFSYSVPAVR